MPGLALPGPRFQPSPKPTVTPSQGDSGTGGDPRALLTSTSHRRRPSHEEASVEIDPILARVMSAFDSYPCAANGVDPSDITSQGNPRPIGCRDAAGQGKNPASQGGLHRGDGVRMCGGTPVPCEPEVQEPPPTSPDGGGRSGGKSVKGHSSAGGGDVVEAIDVDAEDEDHDIPDDEWRRCEVMPPDSKRPLDLFLMEG